MSNTAVTAADAVRNGARFDPWGAIDVEVGPVIDDLKPCREKVMSQWEAMKDTRERWFSAETVASSAVGESAPRTTIRISDVVEVLVVEYMTEHEKLGLPCCSRSTSSPGKSKKRRAPVGPGVTKKQFSVSSPSASCPSFKSAIQKSFEKSGAGISGRDCCNAPVFHGGISITIYLYICKNFPHLQFSNSLNLIRVAVFCMGKMSGKRVAVQELSSQY